MDCSLPGSSVHGIFQARILEWVAMSSSRGLSRPRDQTGISYTSCIGSWILCHSVTSVAQLCTTLCNPMDCSTPGLPASPSITNSQSLLKLMSIELVMPSNHLILCCPLLLLPSIFPSIRVFSNELALHQVAKVLEFQLQHQSFQ